MANEQLRAAGAETSKSVAGWTRRIWWPAGTVVAVGLAGLLLLHVVNGKHGITVWQQKRAEDLQLRKEIGDLEQENARLHNRIEHLKSDPEAIGHEARQTLHYAKPNEVIVKLPPEPKAEPQPGK
ncbi:MAG: septum formation initiator family protein [Terracidiphilus sp.]